MSKETLMIPPEAISYLAKDMEELTKHINCRQATRILLGYAKILHLLCELFTEQEKEYESQGSGTGHC